MKFTVAYSLVMIMSASAIPNNHPRQSTAQSASDITVPFIAPVFPDVAAVPIGSYVCNSNKLYQSATMTSVNATWNLLDTCKPGTYCKVRIGKYVGCDVSPM
ncbi:hypothetical protein BDR26DRAFT_852512 [Obelidium mucronatum]|nr:hypothetical protein BDR26DRAFT_852512 [Obelidium mucronatum]